MTAPLATSLFDLARTYLERQVWFHRAIAGKPEGELSLVAADVLRHDEPGLARLLVARGSQRFQLLAGWREATAVGGVLKGRESALLGSAPVPGDGTQGVLVYDALADDDLLTRLLALVTEGREHAERVRRVATLVSHASLVFDERLFMKCYRVLEEGERPEVEMMFRLEAAGFAALLQPVARWRGYGCDLAVVREFLPSALEGRLLALTSLRDLLAHASGTDEQGGVGSLGGEIDPDAETASAGGDFSAEMRRLGVMTAGLHAAMSTAFGAQAAEPARVAKIIAAGGSPRLAALGEQIGAAAPESLGASIRVHGDYHLRRVMRAERGWLVAGFGDDPLYASAKPDPSLAPRVGSPIEDLADMCFSLHRVAAEALAQRPASEAEVAADLAAAWERRNCEAFLAGYLRSPEVQVLLPGSSETVELLLTAFGAVRAHRYEATPSAR
ncbi:MAG: hypothetical protein M0004_04910 [Actinomycetota bacterium]|nr:hypothetical protein [Actinomycetota bacterium]